MKKQILLIILITLTIISCSSPRIGLLAENNSLLINDINNIKDFFKVLFVLETSIIIVSIGLALIGLVGVGTFISYLLHFIGIIYFRDYGFFNVLLLFIATIPISYIITILLIRFDSDKIFGIIFWLVIIIGLISKCS